MNTPADAPRRMSRGRAVVLDTSWVPGSGDADGLVPLRAVLDRILNEVNLFELSLATLDGWAEACGLADRFTLSGVTWWFHARSFVRLDMQELLLWGRVLDAVAPAGEYDTILVPSDRPLLAEAARATPGGPVVRLVRGSAASTSDSSGKPTTVAQGPATATRGPRLRRLARRVGWRVERSVIALGAKLPALPRRLLVGHRVSLLLDRVAAMAATPNGVLAVVRAASYHHVEAGAGTVRRDPYVSPVLERLEQDGTTTETVALSMDHRDDDDWAAIERDERLVPISIVTALKPSRTNPEAVAARLRTIPAVPIEVDGRDLGPALRSIVGSLAPWLEQQHRQLLTAERLIQALRPTALVTGWEAARTAWIGAARRTGIPSIAIQHGVIYPGTPDYCRPEHPALVRPDVTCVYGQYERQILTTQGGYEEGEVVATGSPRIDPAAAPVRGSEDERRAVRAELGVADGVRVLVVSGGRMTVGDRLQNVPLLARVLDGPLGDVHLVVKLHPEESSGDHYRDLVERLAFQGGYAPPPVTVVRDTDLYRLLRSADAHLGVYSTVLTDCVLVGTPNLIVVGQAFADLLGYVASGVAVPVQSAADVREFMLDPRPPSEEARKRFIAEHFRTGNAAARIAEVIEAAVVARAPGWVHAA